ncbi:MAG TPA: hypothetical protein PKC91_15315 [Ignavibacteria bacterium]|nr:hypothetical protein [Ignavibacteria bacterium]
MNTNNLFKIIVLAFLFGRLSSCSKNNNDTVNKANKIETEKISETNLNETDEDLITE